MMVHQLSVSHSGKYEELKQYIENDEQLMNQIVDVYMKRCTLDETDLRELLKTDKFLTSKECLEMGFVDKIM